MQEVSNVGGFAKSTTVSSECAPTLFVIDVDNVTTHTHTHTHTLLRYHQLKEMANIT